MFILQQMNKFIQTFKFFTSNLILRQTRYLNIHSHGFSEFKNQSKADLLKTYLQIIPPHEIYQIVEKRQKKLQNLIAQAQQVNNSLVLLSNQKKVIEVAQHMNKNTSIQSLSKLQQQQQIIFKKIHHYVKKNSQTIPISFLSKIVELVIFNSPKSSIKKVDTLKRQILLKILRDFKKKCEFLPLQDIVDFIYKLAKLNINQYELMKAAENVIIEIPLKVNFIMIKKILWAYTHLNVGSSVLYSHISKTIKVGQYELEPLQLAESAYMLSKVSQNAKGGYGIFQIAQKHIETNLSRMSFNQLVKASSYLLAQNIGTNQFQFKLQAEIYKKYPSKDQLSLTDFIMLLKATSAYYFKFNDKSLFNMLKTSTERQTKNSTLEQFEDIIWSWGRLGKGDKQLWECLQANIKRRIQLLKPRQIAFFYHSLSSTIHADASLLSCLQQKFLRIDETQVNQHYYIKMLLGMHRQKQYSKQSFIKISSLISLRIKNLSSTELIGFACVLNQSDYDYANKKSIQSIIVAINQYGNTQIIKKIYQLKITQITEILYTYIKLEIENQELIKQCFLMLSDVINIPKKSFIKAFFCFTIKDHYEKAYKMILILEELLRYGPIGYFFSPYEFPLLAYCIVHLHYHSKGAIKVNQKLLSQVMLTLKQINPVILNDFVRKAYEEAFAILGQFNQNKTVNRKQ